jgi:hypothetical protein
VNNNAVHSFTFQNNNGNSNGFQMPLNNNHKQLPYFQNNSNSNNIAGEVIYRE